MSLNLVEEESSKELGTQSKFAVALHSLIGGDGLRARIFRGGAWLGVGSASEQVLRFARNMVLARLIAPAAFGTMAIVMSAAALLQAFTELGVRDGLIQNPRGSEDRYVNAAWWMAMGRSVGIYLILFLIAPGVAKFYGNPALTSLLRVATISLLLEGAMSARAYIAMKDMKFSRWAAITHGGGILGVLTTVVLGFVLRDVWALVLGSCAEGGFRCALSYVVCPHFPSLKFDKAAFRDLARFSRGLLGLAPLVIIYMRMDIFVLGKLIPATELGLYSLGIAIAQVPAMFIANLLGQLFMPALAHVQNDKERTRRIVLQVTAVMIIVAMPAVVFSYFCGRSVLTLAYGPRYAEAAVPLMLAACCALVAFVNNQITTAFYAAGAPGLHRLCVIAMAVAVLVLSYPLALWLGPSGAQLASLIAITIGFSIQLKRANRLLGVQFSDYGRLFLQGIAVSSIVAVVCLIVRYFSGGTPPTLTLVTGMLGLMIAYGLAAWRFTRSPKLIVELI